jgi:hypothetical protein
VILNHLTEVDSADDVHVVKEEGLIDSGGILQKKPGGFFQAAARVEEEIVFAGNLDAHTEIIFGFEIVDDHASEMMDVDDGFGDAEGTQAGNGDFEERAAVDFDQGFGARVRERAEASAEAGG